CFVCKERIPCAYIDAPLEAAQIGGVVDRLTQGVEYLAGPLERTGWAIRQLHGALGCRVRWRVGMVGDEFLVALVDLRQWYTGREVIDAAHAGGRRRAKAGRSMERGAPQGPLPGMSAVAALRRR